MTKKLAIALIFLLMLTAGVMWLCTRWTYSDGQRAGYVQSLSRRGIGCKTWEGDLAMVTLPGTIAEKFHFTIPSDAVANRLSANAGRLVALHYQQHKWKLNSCLGDSLYYVTDFRLVQ